MAQYLCYDACLSQQAPFQAKDACGALFSLKSCKSLSYGFCLMFNHLSFPLSSLEATKVSIELVLGYAALNHSPVTERRFGPAVYRMNTPSICVPHPLPPPISSCCPSRAPPTRPRSRHTTSCIVVRLRSRGCESEKCSSSGHLVHFENRCICVCVHVVRERLDELARSGGGRGERSGSHA